MLHVVGNIYLHPFPLVHVAIFHLIFIGKYSIDGSSGIHWLLKGSGEIKTTSANHTLNGRFGNPKNDPRIQFGNEIGPGTDAFVPHQDNFCP